MADIEGKSYVGDIGTAIIIDAGEDLNEATDLMFRVFKPGTTKYIEWEPEVQVDLHKCRYFTKSGDFDRSGDYRINLYGKFADWEGDANTVEFHVYALGE